MANKLDSITPSREYSAKSARPSSGGVGGLTAEEVLASRSAHGANLLTPPKRDAWWTLYFEKFDDPVIRILLVAVAMSFGIGLLQGGHFAESIGVLIAVLLSTGLAFANEYKASREFDLLNQMNDYVPVKVVRSGTYGAIPRAEIVVGDTVLLEVGDEIPADGRVMSSDGLEVNESSLTGEVFPVAKQVLKERSTSEQYEAAYGADALMRGTMITCGGGKMVVERVGDATEIGLTARAAAEQTDDKSPLNRQLERLSKWIGVVGFGIALATFAALLVRSVVLGDLALTGPQWGVAAALGVGGALALAPVWLAIIFDYLELRGSDAKMPEALDGGRAWLTCIVAGIALIALAVGAEVAAGVLPSAPTQWLPLPVLQQLLLFFMIAVTVIVVAVPEGLAMSVTLSLAYSVRRMTLTNCLVRRMDACETIGAATHICSDKTGTLTQNVMRVHEASFPHVEAISAGSQIVHEAMSVNSTANLSPQVEGETDVIGNPTEGALLLWLREGGHDYEAIRGSFDQMQRTPFSTENKMMTTLGRSELVPAARLHVKGGVDIVLARCSHYVTAEGVAELSDVARETLSAEVEAMQNRAMRTIGFGYREILDTELLSAKQGVEVAGLTWLGFVAISDPVRPEVPHAVGIAQGAGIEVKMITGDSLETALEIGRLIGLWPQTSTPEAASFMLGTDFQQLDDDDAFEAAQRLKVLARARPADKLRMVRMLERAGGVVAVTGDGTNDAPALNYAAVGLAMGKNGTAVAKEASDIIILDDSFNSITTAVKWGRSLYLNIQRFILFQLTINVAACGIVLLGPFIGVEFPLTVTQMLWVNLIMDTFAALALATEPPEENTMHQPPRKPSDFIVSPEMARKIFVTGGIFLALLIFLIKVPVFGGETELERLTIFFSFFVLLQFWNQFNARTLGSTKSAFTGLTENWWFVAILLVTLIGQILIVTLGGSLFRVTPLDLTTWAALITSTSLVLWIGEAVRFGQRTLAARTTSPA